VLIHNITMSMQGMFGASVSELYLFIKLLINIVYFLVSWSQNKYTCVHRNCDSGLALIYKHAAYGLVQHKLQIMETAWTYDSTLADASQAMLNYGSL